MANRRSLPLLDDLKAKAILKQICQEHGISLDLLRNLIEVQRDNLGRGRQFGISQEFSAVISDFIEQQEEAEDAS
ncbi:DNA modification system-associated small protein [Methylocaldum gracile]|jgi:hypothetical protein